MDGLLQESMTEALDEYVDTHIQKFIESTGKRPVRMYMNKYTYSCIKNWLGVVGLQKFKDIPIEIDNWVEDNMIYFE